MDYFSVDYQGIQSVAQEEARIAQLLGEQADQLLAIMANVATQPSLAGKGYTGKIWSAYSAVSTAVGKVNILNKHLLRVHDKYLECEGKVLSDAEAVVIAKNGFSGQSVKTVKNANQAYSKFETETSQVKVSTLKDVLYDSTIAAWASNAKSADKILLAFKEYRASAGKNAVDTFRDFLSDKGVPEKILRDVYDNWVGKADKVVTDFETIIHGITAIANPEGDDSVTAFKDGAETFFTMITGEAAIVGSTFDLISPNSYLVTRKNELDAQMTAAAGTGNYMEVGALMAGSIVETLGKGSVDVGCQWVSAGIDSIMGTVTSRLLGEKITLSSINESIGQSTGVNPGVVFNDVTADIGDGFSSAVDTFVGWFS